MQEMMRRSLMLAERAKKWGDEADTRLGPTHPLAHCFSMISNHAIITAEMLDCYYARWTTPQEAARVRAMSALDQKRSLEEKDQRLGELFKAMFTHTISIVEHGLREAYRARGTLSARNLSKLKELLNAAHADGWINNEDFDTWGLLTTIRNWTVHNNGHADRDLNKVISGRTFHATKGKMMSDKVDAFLFLTEQATEALHRLSLAAPPDAL